MQYLLCLSYRDKTGWMLVWGCLCWIPSLYTFSSYFLVLNAPSLGLFWEISLLITGIFAIWFHSEVDQQKTDFKNSVDLDNVKQLKVVL